MDKYDLVWSEEDINIIFGFEKFGFDLEAMQPATVFPNVIF